MHLLTLAPYNPPNRGAPGRTRDAGSRSCGLVALVPTLPAGHYLRIHALRSTGAPTAALLAELRRASVAVPAEVDVWRELASTLLATGEAQHHTEALRAALQADLRDDGDDPDTLRVLLAAHEAAGETTSAALVRARLAALAPR
jgi:predicted Zn-dependent protease